MKGHGKHTKTRSHVGFASPGGHSRKGKHIGGATRGLTGAHDGLSSTRAGKKHGGKNKVMK